MWKRSEHTQNTKEWKERRAKMLPCDVIFIFLYRCVVVMEYLIRFSHYLELRGENHEEEVYDFLRKCSGVMLMTAQANELLTRMFNDITTHHFFHLEPSFNDTTRYKNEPFDNLIYARNLIWSYHFY